MRKCFYLALLAVFLACLPRGLLAQEPSPMVVDPPRLSKTVFTNWEPVEVIFTVRYLDGYEPDYEQLKNLSFAPFELEEQNGDNPKIVRRQKYKAENYFDAVYSLRLIGEKKGEVVLPAQKFFYIKLEPGKSREELEVKEFETEAIKLRYDSVLTAGADDIIDRIDFGDFSYQVYFWKGLALGGFLLSMTVCWWVIFRYQPKRKTQKESSGDSQSADLSGVEPLRLSPKEAEEKLIEVLAGLEVSEAEFDNLKRDQIKRHEVEANLCNVLRTFLLAHLSVLSSSDTAREMVLKIAKLKPNFRQATFLSLANRLVGYEKSLYSGREAIFWSLRGEFVFLRQSVRNLKRPLIWWKELGYKWGRRTR